MAKLWILSDLHLRQRDALQLIVPAAIPDADVCVIPGDVCDDFAASINWVGKVIGAKMPVIMVLGNHEFYGSSIPRARREGARIAAGVGVHLLDNTEVTIEGVRFLGAPLWTDFNLQIGGGYAKMDAAIVKQEAIRKSKHELADFAEIYANEVQGQGIIPRLLKPMDLICLHQETVAFLDEALAVPFDGQTVVVTHHAPHPGSVAEEFANDPATACFVSDLSWLIEKRQPDYWVHGHTHTSFNYNVGATQVICNPRGYTRERPGFVWDRVVDTEAIPSDQYRF